MSSVKTTPSVGARPSTTSSPKMASSTTLPRASTVAATRSIASRARSGLLTLTSDISQLPGPRNWAMAGGSNGYRAGLVRRQLTPGLISSLPGTAGLRPSISFWTSYPEPDVDDDGGLFQRRTPLAPHRSDIPDVEGLCRALCLVLLIGALDRVADVLPVLIAEVRELPEGSTTTAEEGASIDDDGFARQVIAAVGHQEGREIPQLLHPPHAAHRVVDRRGIVRPTLISAPPCRFILVGKSAAVVVSALRRRHLFLHDIPMFGDLTIGDAEDIHSHHRFRSPSESGREW